MARRYKDTIQCLKYNIDCHDAPLEILALADLHIGDPHADMDKIQELIDSVKNNPNRYAVLVGDLMNTGIANSKSDVYHETMTAQEALDTCVEMLEPIADKILAVVPGNHEERITRQTGVDMVQELTKRLDIADTYSSTFAVVYLQFGKNPRTCRPLNYTLYINHGHGGGRRPGGKLNSLQDYALVIDADCYIVGHTHLPASFKTATYSTVPARGVAVKREQLFVNTASALGYGGYGARGGYQPASNSYPVVTFDDKWQRMKVTL